MSAQMKKNVRTNENKGNLLKKIEKNVLAIEITGNFSINWISFLGTNKQTDKQTKTIQTQLCSENKPLGAANIMLCNHWLNLEQFGSRNFYLFFLFLFPTKVLYSFPLRVLIWFLLGILVWFLPRIYKIFKLRTTPKPITILTI